MRGFEGPLELGELWSVLDGHAAPGVTHIARQTKTLKLAFDLGPTDMRIRHSRFSMQWKERGQSTDFPKLAPALAAELMKRAGIARVDTDAVAWMPPATVPDGSSLPALEPPPHVVWFVRREGGLDVFTRHAGDAGPPIENGPIPSDGPHKLPIPWSSPAWRSYRDFAGGLVCPDCAASAGRYRVIAGAAPVCGACGSRFER